MINAPFIFNSLSGSGGGGGGPNSHKGGIVSGASFAGTPKTYAVVFSTPYSTANYTVSVDGVDSRSFTYESKTTTGFTINTNANTAIAGEVSWLAVPTGET